MQPARRNLGGGGIFGGGMQRRLQRRPARPAAALGRATAAAWRPWPATNLGTEPDLLEGKSPKFAVAERAERAARRAAGAERTSARKLTYWKLDYEGSPRRYAGAGLALTPSA
jgi:hypothetical protein